MTVKDVELALQRVATEEQRSAFDREWELDCAYTVPGLARFRVNALRQRGALVLPFGLYHFTFRLLTNGGYPRFSRSLYSGREDLFW
jgi:twitching motility protein PilT